jgi:ABC-type glycerol-3-phosphate transport system substrate-binding protein
MTCRRHAIARTENQMKRLALAAAGAAVAGLTACGHAATPSAAPAPHPAGAAAPSAVSGSSFRTAMNGVPEITQELITELKRAGG